MDLFVVPTWARTEPSFLWGRHLFVIALRGGGPDHWLFCRECPTEQLRLAIFSGLGFAVAQALSLGVMRLQVLSAGAAMRMLRGPIPVQ
jgi:hypothetical protein